MDAAGICDVAFLEQMFGLPMLPSAGNFGYYVESEWARARVAGIVEGGVIVEPLVRATVVEQMCVH